MITSTDNIVIVGGGSGGWITASAIIKAFPTKNVTVIESPAVPTVGVGESTLGQFKQFCLFLGIDEVDFMRSTDASYKMSIQFTDFYQKDGGSFHYPFGSPLLSKTVEGINDWFVKKSMFPETPIRDFVHCYYPGAALFESGKFSLNEHGDFDNFNPKRDASYHFDATKFANWLREKYCKPRGVKHISATVTEIKVNDLVGIEKLILNTGDEVTADIFIDCTGFRSLLIGDALKQEFYSYDHILPNNRAWACQVPYKNKELELEGFTNCTAIGNGWVWNTPIWSRLGTGYVYSDKFISPDGAKEEFKQYLMSNKMVIPRTREEVDSLSFRDVPMRIGTYKKTFVKNVVAIGLSAGFIEPLESNGLLTVHEWAIKLLRLLQRPAINEDDKSAYNLATYTQWKSFAEFVAMHYSMSVRTDTEYWKSNFNRNIVEKALLEKDIFMADKPSQFTEHGFNLFMHHKVPNLNSGINWITVGMNWFYFDKITYLYNFKFSEEVEGSSLKSRRYIASFDNFEKRKLRWRRNAESAPTLYEYQKKYIYNEE